MAHSINLEVLHLGMRFEKAFAPKDPKLYPGRDTCQKC